MADYAEQSTEHWKQAIPGLNLAGDELAAGVRISRLHMLQLKHDERALRSFGSHGISGSDDFRLMALLARNANIGLSNADLVTQLGGSKAGMSNRLDRLVNQDLIERLPVPGDRRRHTNRLTHTGANLADELILAVTRARHQAFEGLTGEQLASLAATLKTMIHSLDPDG